MRQDKPFKSPDSRMPSWAESYLVPGLVIAILGVFAAAIVLMPRGVVLPVLSVFAVFGAIVAAVATWLSPRLATLAPVNGWDIAGALTLIGCAAALLGEIEPLIEFLKPIPERSPERV